MKPSERCKAAGLPGGITELAELSGVSRQTLDRWYRQRPQAFSLLLIGASTLKHIHEATKQ